VRLSRRGFPSLRRIAIEGGYQTLERLEKLLRG
jgi:hypothetical protein